MKAINQILAMEEQDYEMKIFRNWSKWCQNHSRIEVPPGKGILIDVRKWQKLLANSPLNKWYMTEYLKCENEFRFLISRYEGSTTVNIDDLNKCYENVFEKMYNIFPVALIESAIGTHKPKAIPAITILTFNSN